MRPLESCQTAASTTVDSLTSGDMFYIGSTLLTGSDLDCASRCLNVSTAWFLDTWPSSADLSSASTDTVFYILSARRGQLDVQQVRLSTYGGRTCVLSCWTVCLECSSCLSVSTTMHCLCLTLCWVNTCHKMAPLNGIWCHKMAPFFEAINLLLQNFWRHKLPLCCVKFW